MADGTGLDRIDSFPYRHRVAEVMGAPLVTARLGTTIAEAARIMSERSVSSVVVVDHDGRPTGIVTERDVLTAVADHRGDAADVPLGRVMSSPVVTIPVRALLHVAMGRMSRLGIRHLVATDDRGTAVGMVTVRGLMRLRSASALVIGDELAVAGSAADIAACRARLPRLAAELLAEGVTAGGVAGVLGSILGDVTARAAELSQAAMAADGLGPAPARWSLLLLGSGGRWESLFGADQDNALVHDGGPDDDPWFAELGRRSCDLLAEAGLPRCHGGVMAANADWRGDLDGWGRRIARWIREPEGQKLLDIHIFVDFRPVLGDAALAESVRAGLRDQAATAPRFLHAMAQAGGSMRSPLGMLGQFITHQGRIDLKTAGLLPLTAAVRLLALKHRITATATAERLTRLAEGGHLKADEAAGLRDGHDLMLRLVLDQQIEDIGRGLTPSNRIDPARLSAATRARLKATFRSTNALASVMRDALSSL